MKVYERICLTNWHVEADNGDRQECKRGQKYATSAPWGDGTVTVFGKFWVRAPDSIFEPLPPSESDVTRLQEWRDRFMAVMDVDGHPVNSAMEELEALAAEIRKDESQEDDDWPPVDERRLMAVNTALIDTPEQQIARAIHTMNPASSYELERSSAGEITGVNVTYENGRIEQFRVLSGDILPLGNSASPFR